MRDLGRERAHNLLLLPDELRLAQFILRHPPNDETNAEIQNEYYHPENSLAEGDDP